MNMSNRLRDRVQIQRRVETDTATGPTIVWTPIERRYASIVSLSAEAISRYQQIDLKVTHKIIFIGIVVLDIGTDRITHGANTYRLMTPRKGDNHKNSIYLAKEV